jgi:hypothetical protein
LPVLEIEERGEILMNEIAANQLIIEIIIRLVTGSDADKASARQMANRLDDAALRRLRVAGQEAEILAETVFFEKCREKRARK